MEERDIPGVSDIDLICFPNVKPPINYKGEFENIIAHYWVAETDHVIGFGGFWSFYDEADIITIGVLPDFRRYKVGSRILLAMLNECIKLDRKYITLEVRISNIAAQKMYEKFGFVNQGIRKGYYLDNREDAVIMSIDDVTQTKELLKEIQKEISNDV